jgi:hypothetical protein
LLNKISNTDLLDSDTYVYRVSNGQLFSAREGLQGDEADKDYNAGGTSGEASAAIYYSQLIRGASSLVYTQDAFHGRLEDWQAKTGVNPALAGRQVDHLRPGEDLEVVMVNRATGYIGSGVGTFGESTQSGLISFSPPKIIMQPPNLKIRVERTNITQAGLTAGDENVHLIGFEGSGLTSDKVITITTEWYEQDGSPLPDDLPGYTGRLAKVVAPNKLGQASSRIANFSIKPGRHIQVVQLPQKDIDRAHFYVHVSGEPIDGKADFSTLGAGQDALQYRPKHYVPFKVPLYDEASTQLAERVRSGVIQNGADPTTIPEVEPAYQWVYRPEMQFSVFDLKQVKYIDQDDTDGDNIYELTTGDSDTKIGYADSYDFLYEILADDLPMLSQFGPERELVFSFGKQEKIVSVGDGLSALDFANIDADITDPEGLLTLSLYQDSDNANILWQYTIPGVDLDIDSDNDNGFNPPFRTSIEDFMESGSLMVNSKIMTIHTGDADGDNLPDLIDYEYASDGTEAPPGFVPLVLELPETIDREKAKVRFTYSASDPNGVTSVEPGETVYDTTYQLPPGHLRLWKINNTKGVNRIASDLNQGGHFIGSNKYVSSAEYKFTDLVNSQAPQINDHTVTIYVEGVRPTTTHEDQKILVQVDPDGDGGLGFIGADAVNVSVVKMELAVDLNRDGEVGFREDKADITTPIKPFRFWVNNDYDVVNYMGDDKPFITSCPGFDPDTENQVCEQWDDPPTQTKNNISDSNFRQIECERDLEDFAPLMLEVELPKTADGYPGLPEGVVFSMKAHNININLYRGVWETGTDYLTNPEIMKNQVLAEYDTDNNGVSEGLYLFNLGVDNQEKTFNQQALNDLFGKSNKVKFVFEGYAASPESCATQPESCYLEIALKKGNEIIASNKGYLQLHDIKNYYDHYSAGTGEEQEGAPVFIQAENLHETGTTQYPFYNINQGQDEGFTNEYIMFVHGWRMQYDERVNFGETAFKRVYWSGYKGRFGLFSWPTGYHPKPAYVYGSDQIDYVIENQQNYGDSEALTRRVGPLLTNLLTALGNGKNVNIFAHSMGNVVVSEALKNAGGRQLVANYVATQAASVAGSYNPLQPFNDTYTDIITTNIKQITFSGPEEAWRFYNWDNSVIDTDFDMPPNHYSYTIPTQNGATHGATKPAFEWQVAHQENWGPAYFAEIGSAAANIVNFYNFRDAALYGWEFNQFTKPNLLSKFDMEGWDPSDWFIGPTYEYKWVCQTCWEVADYPEFEDDDQVLDIYTRDGLPLQWDLQIPLGQDSAEILAHIVPARTKALGQVPATATDNSSSIKDAVNLQEDQFGFTNSNQDHSAEFNNTFAKRQDYWGTLLKEFGFGTLQGN